MFQAGNEDDRVDSENEVLDDPSQRRELPDKTAPTVSYDKALGTYDPPSLYDAPPTPSMGEEGKSPFVRVPSTTDGAQEEEDTTKQVNEAIYASDARTRWEA